MDVAPSVVVAAAAAEPEPNKADEGESDGSDAPAPVALSKNAQKKLARREAREEGHRKKKEAKKEQSKAAADERWQAAQQKTAAFTDEERAAFDARKVANIAARQAAKEAQRVKAAAALSAPQNIVIDCAFEDLMAANHARSLCQQLAYSYAANRRAAEPCRLTICGMGPAVSAGLNKLSGVETWPIIRSEKHYPELFATRQADLVYLTADSPHELGALSSSDVYIIGGIVDRNRFKLLTLNKAEKDGIRTAKLPIGEHLAMLGSPVLTVNQVMDIMLAYMELKDWGAALARAVPQRKHALMGLDGEDGDDAPAARPTKQQRRRGGLDAGAGGAAGSDAGEGAAEEAAVEGAAAEGDVKGDDVGGAAAGEAAAAEGAGGPL